MSGLVTTYLFAYVTNITNKRPANQLQKDD